MEEVWVVIPVFNESGALKLVLPELLQAYPNCVVVDDGSTDGSAATARAFPVHVVRHPINLGQGAALQTGISYALLNGADVIVTFDADGQMDPKEIPVLCEPVLSGVADVALGSRFLSPSKDGRPPMSRLILLKLATVFTRLTTKLPVSDTHNGFRAFSKRVAEKLRIRHNRMAHATEILHRIRFNKWRFKEVPVTIRYSSYSMRKGQSSVNLINILWDLVFKD